MNFNSLIFRSGEPIIRSTLDMDFYKFTMGRVIWEKYPGVHTVFQMMNRTKSVRLVEHIDKGELSEQLEHCRILKPTISEMHYLRGTNEYSERMFPEGYLSYYKDRTLSLPSIDIKDGQYDVRTTDGLWLKDSEWETKVLAITNELYSRSLLKGYSRFQLEAMQARGQVRLDADIRLLRKHPGLTLSDFGSRRRFSALWQEYVVQVMAAELPGQFLGTSNTYLAMKYGLMPIGTSAHEMYMVLAGMMNESDDSIRASHRRMLTDWYDVYGPGLSIALTDTFGTEFFFNDFIEEMAHKWKGFRHDSGDPIKFGERVLRFYRELGIDAREKMIVFSDGLDAQTMVKLYLHFEGRIRVTFGWGTNLTNNFGLLTLSLVMKAILANGVPLVKLSDNPAKATGLPEQIKRIMAVFGYHPELYSYVPCIR